MNLCSTDSNSVSIPMYLHMYILGRDAKKNFSDADK